jgi:hypothetical protein
MFASASPPVHVKFCFKGGDGCCMCVFLKVFKRRQKRAYVCVCDYASTPSKHEICKKGSDTETLAC